MYAIKEIISQTPYKFSALVSFNDKQPEYYEIDFDTLDREAAALSAEREALTKKASAKASEFNSISGMIEAEEDLGRKDQLENFKKNLLDQANAIMVELNQVEAAMDAYSAKKADQAGYIDTILTKVAEDDLAKTSLPTPAPVQITEDGKITL